MHVVVKEIGMTKAKTGLDSKKSKATKSVQRSIKTPKTTKEFQAIMRQFTILARNPNMDDEVLAFLYSYI